MPIFLEQLFQCERDKFLNFNSNKYGQNTVFGGIAQAN